MVLGRALSRLDNGQGLKITANIRVILIGCAVFVYGLLHIGHTAKRKHQKLLIDLESVKCEDTSKQVKNPHRLTKEDK